MSEMIFAAMAVCWLVGVGCVGRETKVDSSTRSRNQNIALDVHRSENAKALRRVAPGVIEFDIPASMYPRKELEEKWKTGPKSPEKREEIEKLRAKADPYLSISEARWRELIPNRSPSPINDEPGNKTDVRCPFCDAVVGCAGYEPLDLIKDPFTLKTKCCGRIIHERPEDRSQTEKSLIKGRVAIPHYDGEPRSLDYIESPVWQKKNGEPVRLYPANMVWSVRLADIIGDWGGGAVRDLTRAYLATGDEKYAKALIVILERLAEVFPNFPLCRHNRVDSRSKQELETMAAEHQAPDKFAWRGSCRLRASLQNFRVPWEGYSSGVLARAFMAVEGASSWGGAEEAKKRKAKVRDDLLRELSLVLSAYGGGECVGNGNGLYVPGLLALGIALQNQYFYQSVVKTLEDFLYNSNNYDGTANEGSLNYANMTSGMFGMYDQAGLTKNDQYLSQNPLLKIANQSRKRMRSIRDVPSQHGDGPNWCFMTKETLKDKSGSELRESSVVFGAYGMSLLRAGAPGERMEVMFSHDRITGHAHDDMLGIQFFFDGVPVLDYLGDTRLNRFVDLRPEKNPKAAELMGAEYPAPMVPSDMNRKTFHLDYTNSPLAKNTVIIDEYDNQAFGHSPFRGGTAPYGNLRVFKGGETPDTIESEFQFAEATGEGMLTHHLRGLRDYRRSLICVTRPDGAPYAVDVFRTSGGKRHLMLYHSRGEEINSTIPQPKPWPELKDWLRDQFKDRGELTPAKHDLLVNEKTGADANLLKNVSACRNSSSLWSHTFKLDYAAWAPKTLPNEPSPEEWREKGLKPVYLKIFGVKLPYERYANFLLRAKTNYPGVVREKAGSGMVEFADALNYVGALRRDGELSTTFVHVLEPWKDGGNPSIKTVSALDQTGDKPLAGAVALKIVFQDGGEDIVFYRPPGETPVAFEDGLVFDGRCGLIRLSPTREIVEARLVSGERLDFQGKPVLKTRRRNYAGTVVAIEGDVSGDRSQSVLVIKPHGKWPSGKRLAEQIVSVAFNQGRRWENYRVANVESGADDTVRVVLKDAPPFVDNWGDVLNNDGLRDRRAELSMNSFIGSKCRDMLTTGYLKGSRLAFPELGLEFTLKGGVFLSFLPVPRLRYDILENVDLVKAGVREGMTFAIFPDYRDATVSIAGECGFRLNDDGTKTYFGNLSRKMETHHD